MSKTAAAEQAHPSRPASIPDDLVRLILLRLDPSVCLVRAASTCKRWRSIIATDDVFLRLSRALHRSGIAGHYHLCTKTNKFIPLMPNVNDGSRFSSFDFLPGFGEKDNKWWIADCYGGLVLLCKLKNYSFFKRSKLFVCDPLTRQCVQVDHPMRNVFDPNCYFSTDLRHGDSATLMDGEADGGGSISLSNFRVLYIEGYVFSTAETGGGWPWRRLNTTPAAAADLKGGTMGHVAGRVDWSLLLGLKRGRLMALDKACLDFSENDLRTSMDPSNPYSYSSFRVVNSFGEPQTVRVVHVKGEDLEVFRRANGGWMLEHRIPRLSEATCRLQPGYPEKKYCNWNVEAVGDGPGFVVLWAHHCNLVFSVNLETMEMAAVPDEMYRGPTCSYTLPWPSFQACITEPTTVPFCGGDKV